MTDEIKEILKYIDQFVYVDQTYNDMKLSKVDGKLILDYITNLQKENEKLDSQNTLNKLYWEKLEQRIDKAIEIINKYGKEKQLEEDYLMNRVNLANYNCLLLDILEKGE